MKLVELYYRQYLRKPILDELIFFVTARCNFRCKTCFYLHHENKVNELTVEEISKVSASIGKLSTLFISGGEPFLRNDLEQICEIFYFGNKISGIHIPTNGFYTDKVYNYTYRIAEKYPRINFTISLPLDGLEETHDYIKGVKGSFKKVIDTAEALACLKRKYANLKIYIITVVNNKNVNEIQKLSEFVKCNLLVDGHGPSPMRGIPLDEELLSPTYKEWRKLSRQLMDYHWYWNKKNHNIYKAYLFTKRVKYLYKIYTYVLKGTKLPFRCQAGNAIAVLEPNGDVKLCELTQAIGNVRDNNYDFMKMLFSDKAESVRKEIKNCTCTHACFLSPSIKMNPMSLMRSCVGV